MRSIWLCLLILGVRMVALAEIPAAIQVPTPVEITVPSLVSIQFNADAKNIILRAEAGQDCVIYTAGFTATCTCPARLTGQLVPPPGAPGGLVWSWNYQNGETEFFLSKTGTYSGSVTIAVHGIERNTPAGTFNGGSMTICIDAL